MTTEVQPAVITRAEYDALTAKIDRLAELAEAEHRRQQAMVELQQDVIPIVNQMIQLSIHELEEIGRDFTLEELLFLGKRVLRNVQVWIQLMDQIEGAMGLLEEGQILGKQMFSATVEKLDELERKGYFTFLRGGMYVAEQVVSEFGEEDIKALGDNIVLILKTVRNMTQPEIMALANNAVEAIRGPQTDEPAPSALALLRELNDPQVRRGLARTLNMVKALANEPAGDAISQR